MVAPAVVYRERGNILQAVLDIIAVMAVIYAMYKLFGLFKDLGKAIEEAKEKAESFMNDLKNDLEQAPERFKQTGEDIITIVTKPGTPEGNAAKTRVHYGGAEWGPGTGGKVDRKTGTIRKYGVPVRPGQQVLFDGGWYTNRFVNNLVKSPDSNEYISREDALARKYGFSTYAQFNAWLAGVNAALKAAGKDPSQMSLDEIVKYGRELEKKKEEWRKKHGAGTFDVYKPKPKDKIAAIEAKRWEARARYYLKKRKLQPLPKPAPFPPGSRRILPIFRPVFAK